MGKFEQTVKANFLLELFHRNRLSCYLQTHRDAYFKRHIGFGMTYREMKTDRIIVLGNKFLNNVFQFFSKGSGCIFAFGKTSDNQSAQLF